MCKKQPPQESFYGYYGTGGDYDTTGGYYGRLWRICTTDGQADLMDIRHTWDAGGNLDTREDILESEIELFNYDFLDRLTSVSGAYSAGYTYDEIGNIVTRNGVSYTYDSTQPHAVDSVGGTSYYYDNNGNMTTRGGQTITWDQENMPVSVSGNGTTTTFVYDGDGNRAKKIEGGETIIYINRYYEKNLTTGDVTTSYYLGNRLVAAREGTDLRYIHQDHLTGTALTTLDNGTSLGIIKYYPYGSTRSGDVPTDKKFTGQRLDGTMLYYYNARYYDPQIGRFISPDTIIPDPMNPQSYNRYSYVLNNPLRYNDPSGHIVKIGGAVSIYYTPNGGSNIEMYHRAPSRDESKLINAWQLFKDVSPDVAEQMESSEIVYDIEWTIPGVGSITLGHGGDQSIRIDRNLRSGIDERVAAIIAHETYHAQEGRQSDSVYEEVGAYQREYDVSIALGITPGRDALLCAGINLASEVPTETIKQGLNTRRNESPQYNMYAKLPLIPVGNYFEEMANIAGMVWYLTSYYFR